MGEFRWWYLTSRCKPIDLIYSLLRFSLKSICFDRNMFLYYEAFLASLISGRYASMLAFTMGIVFKSSELIVRDKGESQGNSEFPL